MARPVLRRGSRGPDVRVVQEALRTEVLDGQYGPLTEAVMTRWQREHNLVPDGVVGEKTWDALDQFYELPPERALPPPFDEQTRNAIINLGGSMSITYYRWKDRGVAPRGYTKGMALAFAEAVQRYHLGDPAALEMAKANTHNSDKDALSWYAGIFDNFGMSNDSSGLDTLRHVFVLLMGLGMRESSGRYCEGRDRAAKNVSAITAEAGLYQASWNFERSSPRITELMDEYVAAGGLGTPSPVQCALDIFKEGVTCKAADLQNFGTGKGRDFQLLCKNCPTFCVLSTAVAIRNLRKHWGPLNRFDAEIRPEADAMLKAVQILIAPPTV